jgi:branched-chain amino acid transport system ATP-binding protein
MSVLDNIMVGRHTRIGTNPLAEALFLRSVRRQEVRHREAVERIIELVELEGVRYADAGALPFGTQKLVGLARALALEPSLLLLDEPSAGLSRDERDDLARFILRIKHELKLPMIWIEHDMQMVADLADRIHVLDYGRTLASGTPDRIFSNPAVVAAYLGMSG